jgi:hypothetical protein
LSTLQRILVLVVLIPAAFYLVDSAVFHIRHEPVGKVVVKQYYAVPQKGNKVQFLPADPDSEECANALFPHNGDLPCWYVSRHKQKRIDM